MKTHKFLILTKFLNNFHKENRLVFNEKQSGAPEQEPKDPGEKEKIVEDSKTKKIEASGEIAEPVVQQSPIDNILLDQLNTGNKPQTERQAIFDKLMNGEKISTVGKSPGETTIDLSGFSETQFLILLSLATSTLPEKRVENINKIIDKISPQGPFTAENIGKEAIKILLDVTSGNPPKTKKIMDVIATSPTRFSELIDLYKNDITKLKELLKLIPDYLNIIKKWLTEKQSFDNSALALLIHKDIFPISDFLEDEFINKLSFKTKIDLAKKLPQSYRKNRLINDHIRKNWDKVIKEDPKLIDELLSDRDFQNEILNDLRARFLLDTNRKEIRAMSQKTLALLITKFHSLDKTLTKIIVENIDPETKATFITDAKELFKLPEDQLEEILIALNPLIKTAIEKFGLKRMNGEYRNPKDLGAYFFKGTEPSKIYYRDSVGIYSREIQGEEEWTTEKELDNSKKSEAETLMPLEKDFGQDFVTTGQAVLWDDKQNFMIPEGERLSIISGEEGGKKVKEGRELIKVKWLKTNKIGFVEKSFMKKSDMELKGEKAREIYEQYFVDCEKIEETERSIGKGAYHTGTEKAQAYTSNPPTKTALGSNTVLEISDGKIYEITSASNPESTIFVVKYENAKTEKGENLNPDSGYIEIDKLIRGKDLTQKTAPEKIKYEESEWTKEEYSKEKKVPKDKETTIHTQTLIFGTDENFPETAETLPAKTTITIIEDKVRLVKTIEYIKIKTTVEGKTLTGWIPLLSINIQTSEIFEATTSEKVVKTVSRTKKDDVLIPDSEDPSKEKFTVDFKHKEDNKDHGKVDKKLQSSTRITDLFPTSENGDQIEITPVGQTESVTAEFKDNDYYIVEKGSITKKRATIMDGDKIEFKPKRGKEIEVVKTLEDDSVIKVINFRDSEGKLNKTLERTVKLTDIFTNIKDGDKVIINPKGSSKHDIAEYKDGPSGKTFYYTTVESSKRKPGVRAVIFDGDKVQIVRKESAPEKSIGRQYGKFQLPKTGMTRHDLMQELYKSYPDLQEKIQKAGLTENDYYEEIIKTEDRGPEGSHIYILEPRKSLATELQESQSERRGRRQLVELAESKAQQETVKNFEHYYNDKFKIHESLLKHINNDKLWNDLWANRGTEKSKYINGLEKVITIMRENFHMDQFKTRDTLRKIIQTGSNKQLDFEDVFETLAKPFYLKLREEYGDKLKFRDRFSTYKDFKKDLETTSKTVKKWQEGSKKDDFNKIMDFQKEEAEIKDLEKKARQKGQLSAFKATKKYRKFVEKKKEIADTIAEYKKDYDPSSKRLSILVKEFLVPTARLLDAIADMELGVSKELTGFQKYNNDVEKISETSAELIPEGEPPYYDLSILTSETVKEKTPALTTEELSQITEEGKEKYAVTIAKKPFFAFRKIGEELNLTEKQYSFSEEKTLKIIFQLYSVQTLIKEKCLNKVEGKENILLLTDLPKNFTKDNPAVKELFKSLHADTNIDSRQTIIKETAESLDNNKRILGKLASIYGTEIPKTHLFWTEKFSKWLRREDSRDSITLDMAEIGAGSVTLPGSFFAEHMSGEAAQKDILGKITSIKDGITTLNEKMLETIILKDLEAGLSSISMFARNVPDLTKFKENLEKTYGAKLGFDNIEDGKLNDYFANIVKSYLKDPEAKLSEPDGGNILALIKMGRIFNILTNQDEKLEEKENALKLPEDPAIKNIIEAIIASRKKEGEPDLTQDDVNKIEHACVFGIGMAVGTSGETGGAGIGKSFDLGDGWSIAIGAGLGAKNGGLAGTAGVSASKTFTLSKNSKTQLTVGVDAGYPYIGGRVGISFAISEKASTATTAVGGFIPGGFYAGVGISFQHEPEWERQDASKEKMIKIGYDLIDKMIKENRHEDEIATSIMLLSDVGKDFANLKQKYNLPNSAVIELYKNQRQQTESATTKEMQIGAGGMGGGLGIVWVQAGPIGTPVPNLYIDIPMGSGKVCIFRTTNPESRNLDRKSQEEADKKILEQMRERYGNKEISLMETEIENEGQFIYDSESGQAAFLKEKGSMDLTGYDLTKYNQFNQLNTKLNEIGINLVPDKKTKLTRIEVPSAHGNVKFLIDPEIKEQLILRNGEVYMSMGDNTDLIFQKEDFSYPYKYQGATTLSIITIKRNPTRTRDEIETESPTVIYQRPGYQAEIRKGKSSISISSGEETVPSIRTYEEYQSKDIDPSQLREAEKAEQMNQNYEKFLDLAGVVKERETARENLDVKKFGDEFLNKNMEKYKQLSTRLVNDFHDVKKTQERNNELNDLINSFALNYELAGGEKLGSLRNLEMQRVLTYLMTKSFMKIPEKNKERIFKHNLEKFGRKYLSEFFAEASTNLKKSNPAIEIRTSADLMAQYVIDDLKKVDVKNPEKAKGLEKMGLLSLVGTDGVKGIRGTPLYDPEMASSMLQLTNYKAGSANRIESDIGKVLIEITSPLDTTSAEKFMKSPLAVKMLAHPGTFLILGSDDAMKVAECFNKNTVSEANKTAFEKFQRIVLAIRAAQYSGRNIIDSRTSGINSGDLPEGYKISVNPTTSVGIYEHCYNPTIAFDEGIAIFIPKTNAYATKTQVHTRVDADSRIKYNTFRLGIAVAIEPKPDKPEEPQTVKDLDPGKKAIGIKEEGSTENH